MWQMDIMPGLVYKHADAMTLSSVIHSLVPLMKCSLAAMQYICENRSGALILLHFALCTPIVSLFYLSTLRLNADPS